MWGGDAGVTFGNLLITVSSTVNLNTQLYTVSVTGSSHGQQVFNVPIAGLTQPAVHVQSLRLDNSTLSPQVVMTYFTGGAHCCTATLIVTSDSSNNWSVIDAGQLDGGYDFRDLDGDGALELISVDNSFFYAFAAYASSLAPTQILKLQGSSLRYATLRPEFSGFLRGELQQMESQASSVSDRNGYLGAWVAQKALLGEFAEAWAIMLTRYDPNSGWAMQGCLSGPKTASCPENERHDVGFPEALLALLIQNHYVNAIDADAALAGLQLAAGSPETTTPTKRRCILPFCLGKRIFGER